MAKVEISQRNSTISVTITPDGIMAAFVDTLQSGEIPWLQQRQDVVCRDGVEIEDVVQGKYGIIGHLGGSWNIDLVW